MKKEVRTVVYDDELHIEAYRFEGIVQPFPNHFHEYYVIGFIEGGERVLSCKNQEYTVITGDVLLFNPGDNHTCVQSDDAVSRNFSFTFRKGKQQKVRKKRTASKKKLNSRQSQRQ